MLNIFVVFFLAAYCITVFKYLFAEKHASMCVLVSAVRNVSCDFNDIEICGYQDLSDTGINWSQIRNKSMTVSYYICHVYCTL